MIVVTPSQKRALGIATAIAIVFGAYFLRHYGLLIVFAGIVAFMFNPIYQRLLKRGKKPSSAASITFLVTLVAMIIPITIVLIVTVYQIGGLVDSIKNFSGGTNFTDLLNSIINQINRVLDSIGITYQLTLAEVQNALSEAIKNFGSSIAHSLTSTISSFASFFTIAIIYIYVFMSLLVNQDKLINTFHDINPLGKHISKLYAERTAVMTKAMARGQFIIAAVQGTTDAILLALAGLHSLFFFFVVLLTALSIIPLGGGIVAIPIGIGMILTGHIWQGALVIVGHILIVTNEDNIMRPKLVPKEARLDPALTLVSVFSGLAMFGFLGIVIGPVVMILIVTTIQVFMEVFKQISSVQKSNGHEKSKGAGLVSKLAFWK